MEFIFLRQSQNNTHQQKIKIQIRRKLIFFWFPYTTPRKKINVNWQDFSLAEVNQKLTDERQARDSN